MAEEKGKEEVAEVDKTASPAAKSKKRMMIIAGILVADLLLMVGVAVFVVSRLKTPETKEASHENHDEEEKKKREEMTRIGHTLLKPWSYTVNIGAPGEEHYLKCSIQLEWEGPPSPDGKKEEAGGGGHEGGAALDAMGLEIEKRKDKISDIVINVLTSQTYAELMRPTGKQKIKEAIVTEIAAILPEEHGHLVNAFFTEFLLQ